MVYRLNCVSPKHYDPVSSMEREFGILKKVEKIIDVPRPLAIKKEFNCVLVTEYVHGKSLYSYMEKEHDLYNKLTEVAHLLRKLHNNTGSEYRKDLEFSHFHALLDQLKLDKHHRVKFDHLLGEWWYGTRLDRHHGCLVHNDANPKNYVFRDNKLYALDFESAWEHANPIHDLGIVTAELKKHFEFSKGNRNKAEQYIGHFLWNYSRSMDDFHHITQALPFFISLGLLRMARLDTALEQRAYIFKESEACLRAEH